MGLVFPNSVPNWLSDLNKAEMEQAIHDHVHTIVSHYEEK